MSVFARIVVGVDGTDWGFEALRQALVLAPKENAVLRAVTLSTPPPRSIRGSMPRTTPSS
jgi:nucleotide-binding universal stress UspA family protein